MGAASHLEVCPIAIALGFSAAEVADDNSTRADMQRQDLNRAAEQLKMAAKQVGCKALADDIPKVPRPMPAIGTPELIGYLAQCPAFSLFAQQRNAN